MTTAAIDWGQLFELVWAGALAGVGVSIAFATLILGATRAADHRRADRARVASAYVVAGRPGRLRLRRQRGLRRLRHRLQVAPFDRRAAPVARRAAGPLCASSQFPFEVRRSWYWCLSAATEPATVPPRLPVPRGAP